MKEDTPRRLNAGGMSERQGRLVRAACPMAGETHNRDMLIIHVYIQVKPEFITAFKTATLANASASVQEPGVARFDVCQQADDPTRFVLMEAYRNPAGHAAHRETSHYVTWRDTVNGMMATTRTSVKFENVFPDDSGW